MTTKPTFTLSIDTRILIDLMLKAEPGDVIEYAIMAVALGTTVNGGSAVVQSAIRHLANSHDRVFANIRGVGYQRLTDSDIVKVGEHETRRIRRHAKRAAKVLTKVQDYESLPRADQIAHNARMSLFGAISSLSSERQVKKLADVVEETGSGELPIGRTLEVFSKK